MSLVALNAESGACFFVSGSSVRSLPMESSWSCSDILNISEILLNSLWQVFERCKLPFTVMIMFGPSIFNMR